MAGAVMSGLHQLMEKLNDSNYAMWSYKMQMYLIQAELWYVVTEDPPDEADPQNAKWFKDDAKAMAVIALAVEDSQISFIQFLNTSKECWNALQDVYQRQTTGSKVILTRKLYGMKLKPGESMSNHLKAMREIFNQLRARGMEFTTIHQVYVILSSLDSSYDAVVTMMESQEEKNLTLEYVAGKLLETYERRQASKQQSLNLPVAEFQQSHKSSEVVSALKARKCFNCGSTGHLRRECNNKKKKQPTTKWKEENNTNGTESTKKCLLARVKETMEPWFLDSGASISMAKDKLSFVSLKTNTPEQKCVTLANGTKIQICGVGNVYFDCLGVELQNVLYVPELETNLLSVSQLTDTGYEVCFTEENCAIKQGNKVCVQGIMQDSLYVINTCKENEVVASKVTTKPIANCKPHQECIHLAHRRFGHANYKTISKIPELCEGVKIKPCSNYVECTVCSETKSHRANIPQHSERTTERIFELIHADLAGPFETSQGGNRFFLSIVDDYSRFGFVYVLKKKSETFEKFKAFVKWAKNKFKHPIATLRTDRGGEFLSNQLKKFLIEEGIQHNLTAPNSPFQNGIAERKNKTLQNMLRALLKESGLSNLFWAEALTTSNYLLNRLYHSVHGKTPYEMFYNRKPRVSHVRVFGSKCFVHVQKENRPGKLAQRGLECQLLGYDTQTKGYRLWSPYHKNVIVSRDVVFHEQMQETKQYVSLPVKQKDVETEKIPELSQQEREGEENVEESETVSETLPRRSERERKAPIRYADEFQSKQVSHRALMIAYEPTSFEEIQEMEPTEAKGWHEAMSEEIRAMEKNETWELVPLPEGRKAITSKWVFKVKQNEKGHNPEGLG